jgi:hypothetical protein
VKDDWVKNDQRKQETKIILLKKHANEGTETLTNSMEQSPS